jgi:hypothetical protein
MVIKNHLVGNAMVKWKIAKRHNNPLYSTQKAIKDLAT